MALREDRSFPHKPVAARSSPHTFLTADFVLLACLEVTITATRCDDIGQFYGHLILDYLKQQPDYLCDDLRDIQFALDLQEIEFQLGLDWCKRRNLVTITEDTVHH